VCVCDRGVGSENDVPESKIQDPVQAYSSVVATLWHTYTIGDCGRWHREGVHSIGVADCLRDIVHLSGMNGNLY
jgi:hypothetical protein